MKKFNKDNYLKKLKLKRFWQNNSRYFYIGIPCVLCLVLGIYFTYSKFFVSSEEDVARTTVGEFIYGDIIMTPYVDGQYFSTFPEKKTGINVEKVVCDNDVTASWDEDKWGLYATNLSKRTKCSVYFVTPASCGINDNVNCINSREGLATLATEVNNGDNKSGKIIYLTSDLDLGGKFDGDGNALDGNISWTPIGTYENQFSGIFDGNGHIISNMYINEEERAGLFAYSSNSTLKNFGINNSYIKSSALAAASVVAEGLSITLKNIYSNATIDGKKNSAGIAGAIAGNISNVYNLGVVNSNSTQFAAGVVGYLMWSSSKVKNSYNVAKIYGGFESGGIVGGSPAQILNVYNLGVVLSSSAGGGIVGNINQNQNKFKLENNYYLTGTASYGIFSTKSDDNAEPLSADEMPSVISVINGDNAFVEDTNNINNGYPILKWQAERESN